MSTTPAFASDARIASTTQRSAMPSASVGLRQQYTAAKRGAGGIARTVVLVRVVIGQILAHIELRVHEASQRVSGEQRFETRKARIEAQLTPDRDRPARRLGLIAERPS